MQQSGNDQRTHFARYLIETGRAKDKDQAFKRFLVNGKPGYVRHQWAELADAVRWIRAAGGIAVIAIRDATRSAAG